MSDSDLIAALTVLTDFSYDDFHDIIDVHEYVNRIADVALAGVWTPALTAEAPIASLDFYARRDGLSGVADAADPTTTGQTSSARRIREPSRLAESIFANCGRTIRRSMPSRA